MEKWGTILQQVSFTPISLDLELPRKHNSEFFQGVPREV